MDLQAYRPESGERNFPPAEPGGCHGLQSQDPEHSRQNNEQKDTFSHATGTNCSKVNTVNDVYIIVNIHTPNHYVIQQ